MPIVLMRVDNRLVHGQVLEAWVPRLGIDAILVVDRDVAQDPLRRLVFDGLRRPDLDIRAVTPEQAQLLVSVDLAACRVLILVGSLEGAAEALAAGLAVTSLNLGNIHPKGNSTQVTASVFLTPAEREVLRGLAARGIELDARAVPDDRPPEPAQILDGGP